MRSYASAVEDFNTAVELDPAHADLALFNRAMCYHSMGQLSKVRTCMPVVALLCANINAVSSLYVHTYTHTHTLTNSLMRVQKLTLTH